MLDSVKSLWYIRDFSTAAILTAWKESKYGVLSGPYFLVFGLNTGKYRPGETPSSDTFHAVSISNNCQKVTSRTKSEANISENKLMNCVLINRIFWYDL